MLTIEVHRVWGVPFLCQEGSDSILFDEDLYGVCAVKICVDKRLSAFASEALKKCTGGRIIWGFPFSERPRLRVGHPRAKTVRLQNHYSGRHHGGPYAAFADDFRRCNVKGLFGLRISPRLVHARSEFFGVDA